MSFPVDSYFSVSSLGKKSVIIRVIENSLAFHLIRVQEIESLKEKYLIEYLLDDSAEIDQIPKSDIPK
jgi:hypothetical protein